jgi:predicted phage terminase large subunit-like protein
VSDKLTIAQEVHRRTRARASLIEFSQSIIIPGIPNLAEMHDEEDPLTGKLINNLEGIPWQFKPVESQIALHHALMMNHIQRTMLTPRGRGMIFAPPGTAKSTYASVLGSSWYMGKFPGSQILLGSYATGIAAKQSRRVRSICRDPDYSALWEERPTLNDDQRAIDDWSLSTGSGLLAAGLLAGITGNRFDGAVIDDPTANREQADSATVCDKVASEFIDTVLTRAKPKMWVLLIQTRWSEIDLAGSILPADYNGESGMIKCRDNQVWDVLCLQAECERSDDVLGRRMGEFIWPEYFPPEHWKAFRDNPRAKRTWSALYQQRPAPGTGIIFQRDALEKTMYNADLPPGEIGARPKELRIYGASDYAVTEVEQGKKDPDFTEHAVFGMCPKGELWALDWWYSQAETNVSVDAFIAKVGLWKPSRWAHEAGLIDKALGPYIRRAMRETKRYVVLEPMPSVLDKGLKLEAFHARVGAGGVHFPRNRPWAERVVDQLLRFPGGRFDDAADCCGLIGRLVDKMQEPFIHVPEKREMLIPFTGKWLEWGTGDTKPKVRYTS